MRVTVDGKQLKEALAWGTKGVHRSLGESASGSQAIISMSGNKFTVKSSTPDYGFFTSTINASGLAPGEETEVRIYGPSLIAVIASLDNEPTTIEVTDTEVVLILSRSRFALPRSTVRAPKFPDTPPAIGSVGFDEFKRAAAAAGSFAKPNPVVPVLETVLFEPVNGTNLLRLQATDRVSLIVREIPYIPETSAPDPEEDETTAPHALVPGPLVKSLLSGVTEEGDVTIHINKQHFGISTPRFSGFVGVVEAEPLAYAKVMAQEKILPIKLNVSRTALLGAIKKVTPMLQTGGNLHLEITPTSLTVCNDSGQAKSEVDADAQGTMEDDTTYSIKFLPPVLAQITNHTTSPTIQLIFGIQGKPVVVRDTHADGNAAQDLFLMGMPLR